MSLSSLGVGSLQSLTRCVTLGSPPPALGLMFLTGHVGSRELGLQVGRGRAGLCPD